ncbi:MAG: rRNA maturation RNase YbeY [Bacteroidales bacterium]|nr:rRNA maturation RNase YbeY [Bacteroidales bacterium]
MKIPAEFYQSVEFHFEDCDKFPFPEDKIREWIFFIIKKEKKTPGVLNFIFCSDEYLLKMNVDYLEHDTLTDIITFDYSEDFQNISGDIFISVERVKENAHQLKLGLLYELCRVIAHGVLHITGYGDKHPDEIAVMRSKEDHYLRYAVFL